MYRIARRVLPALGLLFAGTTAQAQFTAYGVTTVAGQQQLVRFSTAAPGTVTTLGPTGSNLLGIDFRPANGVLYGFNGDGLFTVSTSTGAATQIFDVSNTSGAVGFDFNPAADRLRIVDAAGTNLRLNPNDGATLGDPGYTYAAGGMFAGMVPALTGAAYTNNDNDPATATVLYGIDASRNALVQLVNPNGGAANVVGTLTGVTASAISGFDIVTVGGVNTAFLTAFNSTSALSSLYTLNLTSGAASLVGTISVGGGVQGLAIVPATSTIPEPGTYALLATGLAGLGLVARRRTRA